MLSVIVLEIPVTHGIVGSWTDWKHPLPQLSYCLMLMCLDQLELLVVVVGSLVVEQMNGGP